MAETKKSDVNQFSQRYIDIKTLIDDENYLSSLTDKQLKDMLSELKEVHQEYKNFELIVKKDANSLYGTAASIYFSLGDFDIAEDITCTGRHYAVLVDRNINALFVNWGETELKAIQEFYPQVVSLRKFTEYVPDSIHDVCVYGDTDSRYLDLGKVYELMQLPLPDYTPEGDEELCWFALFLMDRFINKIIKNCIAEDVEYRNANPGYLRMSHEVTTRKCVFQGKKKYILTPIFKDGKILKKADLKPVGVELRKGELNGRIKKIIRVLIEKFMLKGYDVMQLREEVVKIINYIKMRKEKDCIFRISAVSAVGSIEKGTNNVWTSRKKHFQVKIAVSWFNFVEKNNLWDEYRPPFEGQKMNFYYDKTGKVIGVPDDVDITKVVGLPEPDWNKMLNQILIKPLLKYIYEEKTITENDVENFLLNIRKLDFN